MDLQGLINDPTSRKGKIFALFIQFLILVSIISFSIDTLPNLSNETKEILGIIEIVTVLIFLIEYILRLYAAKKKLSFVFSFYGIIDLLSIAPFFIAGMDLRALRAFRLLRLIRVFKLVRYNKAIKRFARAFSIAKEEIFLFMFVSLILLYLSSVGIWYFENSVQPESLKSVFHGMWWSVATLTTVGYGDIYPITVGGKIFTFVVLMIGLGIVAVPAGLVATALSAARAEEAKRRSEELKHD